MYLYKPSKLGATGSNPVGRASFPAISASLQRLADATETEQCGNTRHSRAQSRHNFRHTPTTGSAHDAR